ncbi:MAG TPA: ABC transporter substrate-binding protein [Acidimicrobiales bacterium]|nr:ABC transporter substrate-binding protein [Acidimicrobiales bacterium]
MTALVLALAMIASACGSSSGTTTHASGSGNAAATSGREPTGEKPQNGGSMTISVPFESDTWNAATAEWSQSGSLVASSVLEPLAKLNSRGGADPYLATSWIADSTFSKWAINIRPGIKFSDGTPLDANAVALNFNTYVHGALTGQVLGPIFKDVKVTGPLQVLVEFNQPWAAFPSAYLDGNGDMMMAPAMIHSKDGGATHPIGTGPFIFQSWTPGNEFKVTRNPNYWQKGLPHLDSITFRVISDESTAVSALQSGDVDMMLSQDAHSANKLASTETVVKDWDSETISALANTVPSINGTFNPLSDIHARRALAYATDRTAIAKLEGPGVEPATGPWAPNRPWGMPDNQNGYVDYDQAKAKQEIAAYEQDTGKSSLEVTLSTTSDQDALSIAQALQAQWAAVGIKTNISSLDEAAVIKRLIGADFELVYLKNYNYPDPDVDRVFWESSTVQGVGKININFSMYKSTAVDADLTKGAQSGYPSQRKAAYDDLVRQINSAVLNIWLFRTPYSLIASTNVRGLNTARDIPFGNYYPKTWLADLWLKQ